MLNAFTLHDKITSYILNVIIVKIQIIIDITSILGVVRKQKGFAFCSIVSHERDYPFIGVNQGLLTSLNKGPSENGRCCYDGAGTYYTPLIDFMFVRRSCFWDDGGAMQWKVYDACRGIPPRLPAAEKLEDVYLLRKLMSDIYINGFLLPIQISIHTYHAWLRASNTIRFQTFSLELMLILWVPLFPTFM